MRNWKRTFFYIRRGLLRWAVVFFGTLLAQCGLVWILENPDSRMMLYLISGTVIALQSEMCFMAESCRKNKNVPRGVGAPLRGLDNYSITE